MADGHLSRQFLRKLVQGENRLPEPELRQMLHHLLDTCPECQALYDEIVGEWRSRTAGEYEEVVSHLLGSMGETRGHDDRYRAEAEEDWAALAKLTDPERRLRIRRALSRFRSPHLANLLLRESQAAVVRDPFAAQAFAECAHEVALRIPQGQFGPGWAMTAVARANAHRGNALRVQGDFLEAEKLLATAHSQFLREGDGDPLVEAEILKIYGRVKMEQRRFRDAERMLDVALTLFRRCGEERRVAETLIAKGILYSESDRLDLAITAAKGALECIDRGEDARFFLYTQHNLAHYLRDGDALEEARALVQANADLYASFGEPLLELRRLWLLATIERGLGRLEWAEEALTAVRSGFHAKELHYDAALCGLDLALVLFGAGKTSDLKQLAAEIAPVFLDQEIEREAAMAVGLFEEAARQEQLTERMILELFAQLKRQSQRPKRKSA